MESDGVVFIDGSLIEDGALERRRPRRRSNSPRRWGHRRYSERSPSSRGARTAQRREASCGRFKFVEAKDPAPRLWPLGL